MRWQGKPGEFYGTSFARLMIAGVLDGLVLLVVVGMGTPTVAGGVAAVLLVPLAVAATWGWWRNRPVRTDADAEHAVTGWWMKACVGLLFFLVASIVLFEVVDFIAWLSRA